MMPEKVSISGVQPPPTCPRNGVDLQRPYVRGCVIIGLKIPIMYMSCHFRAQKSSRGIHFEVEELNSLNSVRTVSANCMFKKRRTLAFILCLVGFKNEYPTNQEFHIILDPEHCILINACF
jgi:hypothetical protein